MDPRLQDVTSGYRERMGRLAIFDPLYELGRKVTKDESGNSIDWFSLGLISLLFFFESMLTRRKQTSFHDLAQYLQNLNNRGPIITDSKGFDKIAEEIIDTFRGTGKKKEKSFYNWETKQIETFEYALLEVHDSNVAQNIQYYRLSEQGLDLIFATKEYFSEFQLSINQLVLRKQLEKGELNSALREIDEMRVAVEKLHRKMEQLNLEVQRNIISYETQKRYSATIDDIHSRLQREDEEFRELHSFIVEKKKNQAYELNKANEKDQQAYRLLIEIAKELEEVHYQHRTLLHDSITLQRKALQAAKESLYHAGLIAFNFNQDITSFVVATPLPLQSLEGIAQPFLGLEPQRRWSPFELFAPQRTGHEESGEWRIHQFMEAEEQQEDQTFLQQQLHNFRIISEKLAYFMGVSTEIYLSQFVNHLQKLSQEENAVEEIGQVSAKDLLSNRSFYDYWLFVHQRSPMLRGEEEEKQSHLVDEIMAAFPQAEAILVEEERPLLQPHDRYQIQEMKLQIRMKER
ncbi:replicative DNA helicase [Heliorestis convoluta]|uniref:Replicative DNA helicase n=1 Tax=Heliorestis convoluta TaxID=356322 RepID=A0A5Q2N033_9FIRM|nr:replicative DNA helicase [Heliorestis convoluta]QGG48634.1 hypothetical protein FTV88_2541 [Heliorestis convoluta]